MAALRIVVDPNVLISLLIGKRLARLTTIFHDTRFRVIMDDLLLDELDGVARRPKFKKYFPREKVDELVYLIEQQAEIVGPSAQPPARISRDTADDYLLNLCSRTKAKLLLTGDEDLLVLKKYGRRRIIAPQEFIGEFLS